MDLLDRQPGHLAWTTWQRQLHRRGLSDTAQYRRIVGVHETVCASLGHVIGNARAWTELAGGWKDLADDGRELRQGHG
jgi:hypothetical protein